MAIRQTLHVRGLVGWFFPGMLARVIRGDFMLALVLGS